MIFVLAVIGSALFASFFLIVFRGAPYVPTHQRVIDSLFSMYDFQPGEVLVDLGSGDGRVLEAAARRAVHSVGYELNPFLALYSRWRLRRYRDTIVRCQDFWQSSLPQETAVVFVFLAGPFMDKLERKIQSEATRLGHEIHLISYGMKLKGSTPFAEKGGLVHYRIKA